MCPVRTVTHVPSRSSRRPMTRFFLSLTVALRPYPLPHGIAVAMRPAHGQHRVDPRQVFRREAELRPPRKLTQVRCRAGAGDREHSRGCGRGARRWRAPRRWSPHVGGEPAGNIVLARLAERFGSANRGFARRKSEAAMRSGVGGKSVSSRGRPARRRRAQCRAPRRPAPARARARGSERIFGLHCRHRVHGGGAAERGRRDLGEADGIRLAGADHPPSVSATSSIGTPVAAVDVKESTVSIPSRLRLASSA